MDRFGNIDYDAPLPFQKDWRSATKIAHRYINEVVLDSKEAVKLPRIKKYEQDDFLNQLRTSTYRATFTGKGIEDVVETNPHLDHKIKFVKPFAECKLRFIERPIKPMISVSHQDYQYRPGDYSERIPETEPQSQPSVVPIKRVAIDRSKPGYLKYLDPDATVTKLSYPAYDYKDLQNGIGAKDDITYWSWKKTYVPTVRITPGKDNNQCDYKPFNECVKRRLEYRNELKHVPHNGLKTEFRENYIEPKLREREFTVRDLEPLTTFMEITPTPKKTSYQLIGSGKRTQTYL